jgi:hypothetical protein
MVSLNSLLRLRLENEEAVDCIVPVLDSSVYLSAAMTLSGFPMESIDDRNPFGCGDEDVGADECVSWVLFEENREDLYVDGSNECTGSFSSSEEESLLSFLLIVSPCLKYRLDMI